MMKFFAPLIALMTLPSLCFAGFQWVPPTSTAPTPNETFTAEPVHKNAQRAELIARIRTLEEKQTAPYIPPSIPKVEPIIAGSEASAQPVTMPVLQTATAPAQQATIMPPPAFAPPEHAIHGFGTNLPLAIALNDILPIGYTASYAKGINPGTQVSWDGKGQDWKIVVNDMLRPHGLSSLISPNKTVMIASTRRGINTTLQQQPAHEITVEEPTSAPQSALQPQAQNYGQPVDEPTHEPVTLLPMSAP